MANIRRIGILTGGGDCPGLNAAIRATVKTAILQEGWEVFGIRSGFEGLVLPGKVQRLELSDVSRLLIRGGTILGTTNRADPFAYRFKVDGEVREEDRSDQVLRRFCDLGLDGLVVVGGEGSLKIAWRLWQLGLPVVGVPKTIDNDVYGTDFSIGFNTAVTTVTEALDKLHTTAESHHRMMFIEVMGRHAGWIALESGLAGGAHVILIPEIGFRIEGITDAIQRRIDLGKFFSIIVVAEGAHPLGGQVRLLPSADPLGQARLGGIAGWVADRVSERVHLEARVTVLGHVQRGGTPTPLDRSLSTRLGCAAVALIREGKTGQMSALVGNEIQSVPLEGVANGIRQIPGDSMMLRTARGLGISFGE